MKNDEIGAVDHLVSRIKRRKDMGIRYMQSWIYEASMKEEAEEVGHAKGLAKGLEEGLAEGRADLLELLQSLLAQGRTDDIERVITDASYLDSLMAAEKQ